MDDLGKVVISINIIKDYDVIIVEGANKTPNLNENCKPLYIDICLGIAI
jgi:hypothetical protein